MAEADFRLLIVWTNTFLTDGEKGAAAATALFDDPRVAQFHDPDRHVGRALADRIGMPSLAEVAAARGQAPDDLSGRFRDGYLYGEASVFDTMLFFPPDATWGDAPPEPAGWVTQLDPAMFLLDARRFRFGEEMGDEMARLAEVLLRKEEPAPRPPAPLESRLVWDAAPHQAFGDLVRFGGRWIATHREALSHVGSDGVVRVIASDDGEAWESVAVLAESGIDLRDPKLSVAPDGRLLLSCGGVRYDGSAVVERRTRVAASIDGRTFTPLAPAAGLPTSNWFFRLAWHDGVGYCMPNLWDADPATGRIDAATRRIALYRTRDGIAYEPVLLDLGLDRGACEASLAFDPDGTLHAVLRDAYDAQRAWLVRAAAPYDELAVVTLAHGLGGPHLLRLDDGTLLCATREWPHDRVDGVDDYATVVLRLGRDGSIERLWRPESAGDTGYPALAVDGDELVILYYSSHGDRTAVHLARAPLPPPPPRR